MILKKCAVTLLTLFSASLVANVNTQVQKEETWYDLSDPRTVYSSLSVAAGNEGVNISASYGGYLNGQYKHKITVEAMNDLEYYNLDYMLVNASTDSGFTVESTWDRDIWGIKNLNDTSLGVFAKIPLLNNKLNIYPKLNLGMLWGDDVKTTTYIKFDATTRYTFNRMFWVGVTPTYTYAMKGYNVREWDASLDAGVQLSPAFALAAHVNTEEEFWVDVIFAF
ncbi:hypothetical protein [Psychromonas hadalis]|uniref:hypothetical protein n=1 Tax=Psychromonas hadalis TaxID=211669 RepID=UPI0003B63C0A|nr:hypothetical protein [Psychromonas hadalis]